MTTGELRSSLRFAAPQIITASRIVLAAAAIDLALRDRCGTAATLLLWGLITDVLDGECARRLGVATDFGKLFDFFADYLYFVVAPVAMTFTMVNATTFAAVLLSAPCVFAALRYARKAGVDEREYPGIPGSPGVPTVAFALFVVSAALLRRGGAIDPGILSNALLISAPILGVLMIVTTRYPKLSVYPALLGPILAGLFVMPFVLTSVLAGVTIFLIIMYVVTGPFTVQQRGASAVPDRANAGYAAHGKGPRKVRVTPAAHSRRIS